MEVPKVVALVATLTFVVLGVLATRWLQRIETRSEEVRRLAMLTAAQEESIEKDEDAYYYGHYDGFMCTPDLPEVPSLWMAQEVAPASLWMTQTQEVVPTPLWMAQELEVASAPLCMAQVQEMAPILKEVEVEAAVEASPAAAKGICAMCSKPTTQRCKRCKSVKYCTIKCQINHWRNGHKDDCHPLSHGATQDDKPKNVMAATELKDMAFVASTTYEKYSDNKDMLYPHFTRKAESIDSSRLLFSYNNFVELYNFKKMELHPFGLWNLWNSCYANVVLQCLAFTRPLTTYLLEGHHSQNCFKNEWCFMCEVEKVLIEGKHGKSPVSPTGILCHLNEIGVSFGHGDEEDAHEFLRYAIDKMQSASLKEAKKNGIQQLAEETTLVHFIFGGYLLSKITCTKCQVSSIQSERILDLTVEIDGDISTLDGALHRFTSSEILDGDNRYHCSRCNSYERAQKKLTILEAPNILTIALKRYQSDVLGETSKVVKFPEHLNLSQYMCKTDDSSPVYNLYAVVVHHNVANATVSGHYICYVKDYQGEWHKMDDSKVKRVPIQKVLSKRAYMLLYARISPRAPTAAREPMLSQGASSRTKDPKQMARSGSFPSGGDRHRSSKHQQGRLYPI